MRETGSLVSGGTVIWVRATDAGVVQLFMSAGYRDAFARPLLLDAERLRHFADSATALSPSKNQAAQLRSSDLDDGGTRLDRYVGPDSAGLRVERGGAVLLSVRSSPSGELLRLVSDAARLTSQMTPAAAPSRPAVAAAPPAAPPPAAATAPVTSRMVKPPAVTRTAEVTRAPSARAPAARAPVAPAKTHRPPLAAPARSTHATEAPLPGKAVVVATTVAQRTTEKPPHVSRPAVAAARSSPPAPSAPPPAPPPAPRPASQAGPRPAPQATPRPAPQAAPRPAPQAAPRPAPQAAPRPAPQAAPQAAPPPAPPALVASTPERPAPRPSIKLSLDRAVPRDVASREARPTVAPQRAPTPPTPVLLAAPAPVLADKHIRTPLGPFVVPASVLGDHEAQIRYCYSQLGVRYDPHLTGDLTVRVTVGASGMPDTVEVVQRTWDGVPAAEVESCMHALIEDWTFPPPGGTAVAHALDIRFTFSPKGVTLGKPRPAEASASRR